MVNFCWPIGMLGFSSDLSSNFDSDLAKVSLLLFQHSLLNLRISSIRFSLPRCDGRLSSVACSVLTPMPHSFGRKRKKAYEWYLTSGAGYAFGYWFNGWIERSRRINWLPEYRLHGVWIAIGTMACGLLTYGFILNYGKHWIGLAFGWGMVVAGMIASTVLVLPHILVLCSTYLPISTSEGPSLRIALRSIPISQLLCLLSSTHGAQQVVSPLGISSLLGLRETVSRLFSALRLLLLLQC